MKVSGKAIINNTYLYLYPCLQEHSQELLFKMRSFYKLAIAVGDDYDTLPFGEYIYIVFSTEERSPGYRARFEKFLNWVREVDYYKKDYTYNENAHTLVLKMPDRFYDLPVKLMNNEYKGIYTDDEIKKFYNTKYISITPELLLKVIAVIKQDKEYFPTFVAEVNKKFATNIAEHELLHVKSYELGLLLSDNVLNYNTNIMAGQ